MTALTTDKPITHRKPPTPPQVGRVRAGTLGYEWAIVGPDQKWHHYMNCERPATGACICAKCGHGYAELTGAINKRCSECMLEIARERAAAIEGELGIVLTSHSADPISQRMRYGFRDLFKHLHHHRA